MKSFLKVTFAAGAVAATMAFASGTAQAEPMVASYYGAELAGNPTASGEPFDPSGYTAASKTLPFGTQLEVCYQGCVTVTVNDRGPYVAGRDLDLSQGAAEAIGLGGVGTVDATVVGSGEASTTDATQTAYSDTYDPYYGSYATGYYAYDAYGNPYFVSY